MKLDDLSKDDLSKDDLNKNATKTPDSDDSRSNDLKEDPLLSICITTRNRPQELIKCLNSISKLRGINFEVVVSDDASDKPVFSQIIDAVAPSVIAKARLIRFEENIGLIAARNELAKLARSPYILSLDDDAILYKPDVIYKAIKILERDSAIGAIALTQSGEDGTLLPKGKQPAPVDYPCIACSYIGFGHIIRRDLFLSLGGYRSIFWYGYEEAEYAKRMLDRGFNVLFLPDVGIIHYHSPIGRSQLKHMRNGCRNKCLAAIYNEPFLMAAASIPSRLVHYFVSRGKVCKEHNISDEGGMRWLVQEISQNFLAVWRERKALKWTTYFRWRQIHKDYPLYELSPQNTSKNVSDSVPESISTGVSTKVS
ncbi:MAG: glycosyltransferase family 2 protein [Phormidesmis sp.]